MDTIEMKFIGNNTKPVNTVVRGESFLNFRG